MAKRRMSENSLNNLQPFTKGSEKSRECQKKAVAKRKENKTIEEYKDGIIFLTFKQVYEKVESGQLTNQDLIDIFKTAVDMSGYKKQTQELQGLSDIKITREIV